MSLTVAWPPSVYSSVYENGGGCCRTQLQAETNGCMSRPGVIGWLGRTFCCTKAFISRSYFLRPYSMRPGAGVTSNFQHLGHLRQPIDTRFLYADEQTIGTGHVGSSGTGVSRARVQTGLLGVVEVNGVLRQYDGQGQYTNDQPLRDVLLGRFDAPRKQGVRAEDGHEENGRFEHRDRMDANETEVESGSVASTAKAT